MCGENYQFPSRIDTGIGGEGPGVLVLHEWQGLAEPFQQAYDRLAEAEFVALAPDSSRGKTTASIEEAEAVGAELDQNVEHWHGDIVGALPFLRQHGATRPIDVRGAFDMVAFLNAELRRSVRSVPYGREDSKCIKPNSLWIKTAKRLYVAQPKRVFLTREYPATSYDTMRPVASSDSWLFV